MQLKKKIFNPPPIKYKSSCLFVEVIGVHLIFKFNWLKVHNIPLSPFNQNHTVFEKFKLKVPKHKIYLISIKIQNLQH